ncbi:TIGR03086 family protein [Streptacidiphilus sp. PB12-B1b]|uniref:TIGR03086 family metal-binding protein n=1 Tax=Streptacidiphilus sp. PB12-B1b TaxID=2705012 RepID=UPI0015FA9A1B|nr:TIGR03086 family metal-binding protein [Streptacidiphilus sp. PB12-B1b]QMU75570.1 TIGR03086 family protein [Streptacidiphilus sp. PB12-B1b]
MTTLLPQLTAAAAEAVRTARAVAPEQLDDPTPDTEWNVRTLANHLVLWTSYNFELRARGASAPEEMQRRDFTAEPGWAEDYADRLDRALAAWSDPAVWEGEVTMGDSSMPAAAVAGMILLEIALHGWELAVATGQQPQIAEPVAESVLGLVGEYADMYRSYPGGFAPALPVADDAPAFARALALSGRDPHWTAG